MEVMQILTENNCSHLVIAAGILHDTLEDTGTTPAEILDRFGESVLKIVAAESEDKSKSWKERKQATIDHLAGASLEAKLVCCADKLSNLRSMAADLNDVGEKLWERFNADKADIAWYYRGIAEALPDLAGYKMYQDLKELYDAVFVNLSDKEYFSVKCPECGRILNVNYMDEFDKSLVYVAARWGEFVPPSCGMVLCHCGEKSWIQVKEKTKARP
jgi:(p)ppGpp synthase/HD superfamily hydrolase